MAGFEPSCRQRLGFAGTSSCPLPPPQQSSQDSGGKGKRGREKRWRVGGEISGAFGEGVKKAWYEGPSVSNVCEFTSELPFITKLSKTKPTSSHSNSIDESHSGSNDCSKNGTGSPQKQSYSIPSVLPPLWAEGEGRVWRVMHVSVEVGRVVVYCGEGGEQEREEPGCFAVNHAPAKAVVVYHTEDMSCSLTRYCYNFRAS